MVEKQPRQELSEQFATDLVYFNFVRLAQTYGIRPSENRIASNKRPGLNPDTRTLTVEDIPSDDPKQGYPDFISGIDWAGYNAVEIYYQKGIKSAKVYITKGVKSGKTKMHTIRVLDKQPIEGKGKAHTLKLIDENTTKPDIYAIASLLKKTELVLEEREKARLISRFDKPSLTLRQKLSRRIEDSLR